MTKWFPYGLFINVVDEFGRTPLHYGVMRRDKKMVKALLEDGALTNVADMYGQTPLSYARSRQFRSDEISGLLRRAGASIFGEDGTFVLYCAQDDTSTYDERNRESFEDTVSALDLKTDYGVGITPYLISSPVSLETSAISVFPGTLDGHHENRFDENDAEEALNDNEQPLIHQTVANGCIESVESLLPDGIDLNLRNTLGQTPLHVSAVMGKTDILELLAHWDAPLNAQDNEGRSPLYLCISSQHKEGARILIEMGASCNTRNNDGQTPLHAAAWMGQNDIVDLLLQRGGVINASDEMKRTPLHMSSFNGHINAVESLLKGGADLTKEDRHRNTALELAQCQKHKDIVAMLKKAMGPQKKESKARFSITRTVKSVFRFKFKAGLLKAKEEDGAADEVGDETLVNPVSKPKATICEDGSRQSSTNLKRLNTRSSRTDVCAHHLKEMAEPLKSVVSNHLEKLGKGEIDKCTCDVAGAYKKDKLRVTFKINYIQHTSKTVYSESATIQQTGGVLGVGSQMKIVYPGETDDNSDDTEDGNSERDDACSQTSDSSFA